MAYNEPGDKVWSGGETIDWRKCCADCWLDENCSHWTVVRKGSDGEGCWLKSESGNKSRKIGATSGTRSCLEYF